MSTTEHPSPVRRATAEDAFRLARRWFLAGERVDMQSLAAELGVARTTLYRWTGDRELLMGAVVASIILQTIDDAKARATSSGPDRILDLVRVVIDSAAAAPFLKSFLDNEPGFALRIVTGRRAGVQGGVVGAFAAVIREEQAAATVETGVDADTLAYAIVRLMEAFLYNDTITGVEPHTEHALAVVGLLLRR